MSTTVIDYAWHLDCDTLSGHISRPENAHELRSLIGDDLPCWKSNIVRQQPGDAGTGRHRVEAFVVGETATALTPFAEVPRGDVLHPTRRPPCPTTNT